ncbi:MAG: hypothetical protein ACR2JP_00655 [Acidimicrobiia bacterium]
MTATVAASLPERSETTAGPVVFAAATPLDDPGAPLITEALPRAIRPVEPSHWVIVDPVAFPWETMTERQWDAPISVVLPDQFSADDLFAVLGEPLLDRLTPFDVVVSPPPLWAALRPRYGLSELQWRRPLGGTDLVVRHLVQAAWRADVVADRLATGDALEDGPRLVSKWNARSRLAKGRHRAEAAIVGPLVHEALAAAPAGGSRSAVEFSDGAHGFVSLLGRSAVSVAVARNDPAVTAHAGLAYPDLPVTGPADGGSLELRREHADLAVGVVEQPYDITSEFLAAVWRGLRVGGTLVAVMRSDTGGWTLHDLSRLVLDASGGHAVLGGVTTVRDPWSGRATSGVFTYTKIGVPTTW